MKRILILVSLYSSSLLLTAQKQETAALIGEIHLDTLLASVGRLTGMEPVVVNSQNQYINTRYYKEPGNETARLYLQSVMESYGYNPYNQLFDQSGENIIAIKEGSLYPERAFIFCAHYDAIAVPFSQAVGADDNASGCAAVLEAARLLKDQTLPYTVIFIFFDMEEPGLVGSIAFTEQFDFDQYSIEAVINVDMIGYDDNLDFRTEIHTQGYANSRELARKMAALNDTFSIGLDVQIIDPGSTASDHDPFWQKNMTAVFLCEDAQDFNRYYHTKFDSMHYFHDSFFYRNTQLAIATLYWFASNPDQDLAFRPALSGRLLLYPNPASQFFYLDAPEAGHWQVFDPNGRLLLEGKTGPGTRRIEVAGIRGLVFVVFCSETGISRTNTLVLNP